MTKLEYWYTNHTKNAFKKFLRKGLSQEEVEDLIHDTVVKTLKTSADENHIVFRKNLDWQYGDFVRNTILFREKKEQFGNEKFEENQASPENEFITQELIENLIANIKTISTRKLDAMEVFTLLYEEGKTQLEVANLLNCSEIGIRKINSKFKKLIEEAIYR